MNINNKAGLKVMVVALAMIFSLFFMGFTAFALIKTNEFKNHVQEYCATQNNFRKNEH